MFISNIMNDSVEPAIAPNHRPSFLLDWEVTLKCNLDCGYCNEWGHDNSTKHPQLAGCLKTIDFMFEYVDLYMQYKPKWARFVVLNMYGGESLFHPDIVEIYEAVRAKYQEKYADKWHLTVNTTTNLIAGHNVLGRLTGLIDYWVASYHTEANDKQKKQFRDNLLFLKKNNSNVKVTVLMNPHKFDDSLSMIEFCKEHDIAHLPRQLDQLEGSDRYNYSAEQIAWFNDFYQINTYKAESHEIEETDNQNLSKVGRACCGGRQLCVNSNYKQRQFFIPNQFTGWSCSINWFFLYIKQVNGNLYTNKDCRMNFDGTEGPIGNLSDTQAVLDALRDMLENKKMPVIQCAKKSCWCGLCTPKAKDLDTFKKIYSKYLDTNPLL